LSPQFALSIPGLFFLWNPIGNSPTRAPLHFPTPPQHHMLRSRLLPLRLLRRPFSTVQSLFSTMEYGPAPEVSDSRARGDQERA
jgi:hypothetical protein